MAKSVFDDYFNNGISLFDNNQQRNDIFNKKARLSDIKSHIESLKAKLKTPLSGNIRQVILSELQQFESEKKYLENLK